MCSSCSDSPSSSAYRGGGDRLLPENNRKGRRPGETNKSDQKDPSADNSTITTKIKTTYLGTWC